MVHQSAAVLLDKQPSPQHTQPNAANYPRHDEPLKEEKDYHHGKFCFVCFHKFQQCLWNRDRFLSSLSDIRFSLLAIFTSGQNPAIRYVNEMNQSNFNKSGPIA
mmetsp:Transcript_40668/g.84658  ORF Transcript_40668/g.84658 Transcript_40668/m.84658 type:complete len:104 (+) Transcript_40668:187-498(+)